MTKESEKKNDLSLYVCMYQMKSFLSTEQKW